jgi:hypothetical protein
MALVVRHPEIADQTVRIGQIHALPGLHAQDSAAEQDPGVHPVRSERHGKMVDLLQPRG